MAADPSTVEHAVSRTLRDNLEKIQHTAEELHQAVNDLVAACASTRPSNALPPMVRAQTSAAALSATLEVLSRFVTSALQSSMRSSFEPEFLHVPSMPSAMPPPLAEQRPPTQPPPPAPHPTPVSRPMAPAPVERPPRVSEAPPPVAAPRRPEPPPAVEMPVAAEPAPPLEPAFLRQPAKVPVSLPEPVLELDPIMIVESQLDTQPVPRAPVPPPLPTPVAQPVPPPAPTPVFRLDSLPPQEQELHRRAYRVAKVSMQDIKLLRPEEVRLGRQNKDLCFRLRDEIEKAHKEYDRRFQAIQAHPVDYFYDWMVEILAGGDPQALGEYPYPSPVLRR